MTCQHKKLKRYRLMRLQRTGGERLMGHTWKMGSRRSGGDPFCLVEKAKCKVLAEGAWMRNGPI